MVPFLYVEFVEENVVVNVIKGFAELNMQYPYIIVVIINL